MDIKGYSHLEALIPIIFWQQQLLEKLVVLKPLALSVEMNWEEISMQPCHRIPHSPKAAQYGMQFVFISREDYRKKMNTHFLKKMNSKFGSFFVIPEGGTNELAVKGCQEILTEEDKQFDYICCCVGTGGTMAGLIKSSKKHQNILGFSALKGNFLKDEIREVCRTSKQLETYDGLPFWRLRKIFRCANYLYQ